MADDTEVMDGEEVPVTLKDLKDSFAKFILTIVLGVKKALMGFLI